MCGPVVPSEGPPPSRTRSGVPFSCNVRLHLNPGSPSGGPPPTSHSLPPSPPSLSGLSFVTPSLQPCQDPHLSGGPRVPLESQPEEDSHWEPVVPRYAPKSRSVRGPSPTVSSGHDKGRRVVGEKKERGKADLETEVQNRNDRDGVFSDVDGNRTTGGPVSRTRSSTGHVRPRSMVDDDRVHRVPVVSSVGHNPGRTVPLTSRLFPLSHPCPTWAPEGPDPDVCPVLRVRLSTIRGSRGLPQETPHRVRSRTRRSTRIKDTDRRH